MRSREYQWGLNGDDYVAYTMIQDSAIARILAETQYQLRMLSHPQPKIISDQCLTIILKHNFGNRSDV